MPAYNGLLAKYGHLLDLPPHTGRVTLLEGGTPLIPAPKLASAMGGGFELWVKYEGLNPTGSFKDRGMTAAVSEALGRGAKTVICASTGNTAASAAAYAARAGMKAIVLIPQGKVAAGKLAGAVAYGAQVIQIEGSFDDALSMVVEITDKHPIALVNSINPYRIEGQKTSAFEICDELESAPDWLCLPVGNAGNITSYWAGFKQYDDLKSTGLPHVLGVQAAGSAPLVLGHPVEQPETVATAIRIGKPARGEQALQAAEEFARTDHRRHRRKHTGYAKDAGSIGRHLGGTGLRRRAGRAGAGDRGREAGSQRQTHRRHLHRARAERPGYYYEVYAEAGGGGTELGALEEVI